MTIEKSLEIFGKHDQNTFEQMKLCLSHDAAVKGALMADGHLGYSQPIGGVLVYDRAISPQGVGFDIACGNKAVKLQCDVDYVRDNIELIMDSVWGTFGFGTGGSNRYQVEDPVLDDPLWNEIEFLPFLKEKASRQLGTIGSGNHYIDIFLDGELQVWVGVHFGSRGLGHAIASHFLKASGAKDGMMTEPKVLEEGTDLFEQYIRCLDLAGRYAYAGRNWVCNRMAVLLRGVIVDEVHNHHNFAWKENGNWVVRKGSTPNFPGQRSFVGGSMGDVSVILEGTDTETNKSALYSTVHGAGRIMSRTEATGMKKWKKGIFKEPKVTQDMMDRWVQEKGVVLRGGGLDESPHCYRRLPDVIREQADSIKIMRVLQPIGVAMAGNESRPED